MPQIFLSALFSFTERSHRTRLSHRGPTALASLTFHKQHELFQIFFFVCGMASAPGRLDFMGGVGDYSGGLVLQVATAATTSVSLSSAACEAGSAVVSLRTASFGAEELPLPWLLQWESSTRALPLSERLSQVRAYLQSQGRPRWVFYVYGCVAAFLGETGWLPEAASSLAVSITSRVPLSQGVSSSASIEVAMLRALRSHSGAPLPDLRLAHVGQAVENFCAGAPCGLMDQLASSLGQAGQVLPILCRPDAVSPLVALPPGVLVVGWPSGAEHALDGASPYALARAATFMAKKALEAALGRKLQHITELLPSQLAAALHAIPEAMTGQAFLEAFGGVDDALSTIVPSHTYSLRAGAQFPVQESFRCVQPPLCLGSSCPHVWCASRILLLQLTPPSLHAPLPLAPPPPCAGAPLPCPCSSHWRARPLAAQPLPPR
jgi:galactokinase